ncbi:MAG: FAD-dependent oxidoreductase [Beijerinckiaceae bacterium]|nr:FAD-dependent oxidoreductase [Beijerinckiaceae bacterium]MCZ8301651.1 FAD-dependent oxidoreductase [Beijerinckiaceae bacterium]
MIGAGPGGLSVAAGAAQMGASVILVEKGEMGGDCLNTGCVPSKALIAAASCAQGFREATGFGITPVEPAIDFAAVQAHVRGVIAGIAPHDSVERFEGLGVVVLAGTGRFLDSRTLAVGESRITARRFVIATGSRAAIPPVPGLADIPYLTNETLFHLDTRPDHLAILGGGPIGMEMAQAFGRLGARVTVLEQGRVLAREDEAAAALVRDALQAEGVIIREGIRLARVEPAQAGLVLHLEGGEHLEASHLLVAAGRRPNVEGLGLEAAGIGVHPAGITVDARLRTGNRRVFAIGDVTGGAQFTHLAGYQAGIVLRNALFGWPARASLASLPRVTYTEPELAQVGLDEATARARHGEIRVLTSPFAENDRARTERRTGGWARILTDRRGRILGATLVGPHAGELIGLWALALQAGLRIGAIAGMVLPYPTLGEISKRAAGQFYTPTLFGAGTRRLVGWIQRFLP